MSFLPVLVWAVFQSPPAAPADLDFKDTWSKIQTSISQRFYAREARKAEMDKLFAKYGPIASAAKSKTEFDKIVNDMIAEFGDSHFSLLTDEDQGYYLMDGLANQQNAAKMPEFGVWYKETPKGYVAGMVLDGSSAMKADIRKGDVFKTVDGQPFSPVTAFKDKSDGATVSIVIERNNQPLTKQVEVHRTPALEMFAEASRDSSRVIDAGGKKIGYFHLWTQASDAFRTALKNAVMGRLRNTDAFILDLRDGFGGRPENFFEPFFMPDITVNYGVGDIAQKSAFGYGTQKPLIVLINEGSRSAKEVSSYMLKKSGRAVLIGTTTAGHVLGTFPARLNAWAILEIPMVDVTADGDRLEKVGVSPNIRVSPEYDVDGKDLVLQRALEYITTGKK